MIIDLNKFVSMNNFKINFTGISNPGIYFLIWVDDNTQRWKRINGQYIPHKDGNYVIDHGFDINNIVPRVLKYIGESSKPLRRLIDHYTNTESNVKEGKKRKGIGPNFTHVRILQNFKTFNFDTIRLHHETLFVRKYLPELNQASNFNKNYKIILKNSHGLVTPQDLIKPHALHATDIFKAYKAWEVEDLNYLDNYLIKRKIENQAGLIHPGKRDTRQYRNKKGNKIKFSRWINDVVMSLHKNQREAVLNWRIRIRKYTRLFNPDRYNLIINRDRAYNKKNYIKNKEFFTETKRIVRRINKKQPELL